MTISVNCPKCNKQYQVRDELAGKRVRCKKCKGVVPIPAADSEEEDFEDYEDYSDDFSSDDDWKSAEDDYIPSSRPSRSKPKKSGSSGRKKKKKRRASPASVFRLPATSSRDLERCFTSCSS